MRYSINPEFDAKLREAFDELGVEEETREALLELMDRAAITFSDRVCRHIARCLVREGLAPDKIKSITGCKLEDFYPSVFH